MLKELLSHSQIAAAKAKIILDGQGNKHFVSELKSYLRHSAVQMKSFSMKDSKKKTCCSWLIMWPAALCAHTNTATMIISGC